MHTESLEFRGTPCIRLHAEGASALVALHGAHVLSWQPADGRDRLFLSDRAVFDGQAAIRGGIPLVFPQFAERGPLRKHGFARTTPWTFHGVDEDAAVFELADDGSRFPGWPHPFRARLHVHLTATRLSVTLEIANCGDTPFSFSAALHTYLRVADIAGTTLEGLQGCDYEDSANGGTLHREHNYDVMFDGEVDRIYADVVAPLLLVDGNGTLAIEQEGFGDVVAWTPGESLAARIRDLAPGEHRQFVCVEAVQVLQPVLLGPGECWTGTQRLG
jgi:glucose-6-phosphate 1-epimerase